MVEGTVADYGLGPGHHDRSLDYRPTRAGPGGHQERSPSVHANAASSQTCVDTEPFAQPVPVSNADVGSYAHAHEHVYAHDHTDATTAHSHADPHTNGLSGYRFRRGAHASGLPARDTDANARRHHAYGHRE